MVRSKSATRFLKHVRKTCKKYGITFKIGQGKTIIMKPFTFKVLGYFDEDNKILACAKGRSEEEFLSILVHEFAHALQWIEKDIRYTDCSHRKYGSVQNAVCLWVQDKLEIRDKELKNYIQKTIACELDAERRSIKIIKTYGLPIDLNRYCSNASATLFSYWVTIKTKQWDVKIGPKQMKASGSSLRRSFKSLPKTVETSFINA
jgi:hypothetical protein